MQLRKKQVYYRHRGAVLIVSMILVLVFSVLAVSLATFTDTNTQLANNQHLANSALLAAQSGMECALYMASTVSLESTAINSVTDAQANTAWTDLCTYLQTAALDGQSVGGASRFTDSSGSGDQILVNNLSVDGAHADFSIRYYRYDGDPKIVKMQSVGTDGVMTRKIFMDMNITKDNDVLHYAVASRGRMWLTGDTTIHGNIYSSWNLSNAKLTQLAPLQDQVQQRLDAGTLNSTTFSSLVSSLGLTTSQRTTVLNELLAGTLSPADAAPRCIGLMSSVPSISPFNLTSDSEVLGTINTCWSQEQIATKSWQLETLDEDGKPMYDEEGNKIISPEDEIQGYCEGIHYKVPPQNMSGMSIADYDTTLYYQMVQTASGGNGNIPCPPATQYTGTDASLDSLPSLWGNKWRYERFPHNSGNYTTGSGVTLKRYIYKDQTFTNVRLPDDKNALFINCTFEGVLYVDCGRTTNNYNNVRFDDCTFNGTIIGDTPQAFNWQKNCLYFTGEATFQNQSSIQEATILAPHFNVNLGNTNPDTGENNTLTGVIVGGIVDIRGNAEIYGTIISMADTSTYTSGYVTNIGATEDDGGSETTEAGDIGVINITPEIDQMLPSGITSPIIIQPLQTTYSEGV